MGSRKRTEATAQRKTAALRLSQDLPFTDRWTKGLDHARRNKGWHLHVASSQSGKTTANRLYCTSHPAERSAAGTTCPVIQIVAKGGRQAILRDIGHALRADKLMRSGGAGSVLPGVIKTVGLELLIINNGHKLEWRQWEDLLSLDDALWGDHDHRLAIVFSSVQLGLDKIIGLPADPELVEQIEKRTRCRRLFENHTQDEVKRAILALLAGTPMAEEFARSHSLVFELLTRPEFDRGRKKKVGAGDLYELLRRAIAVKDAHPAKSAAEALRIAGDKLLSDLGRPQKSVLERVQALADAA